MIRRILLAATMCALIVGVSTTTAGAAERLANLEIPFAFTAGETSMAAGTYTLLANGANKGNLALRNNRTGASVDLVEVTRLADLGLEEPKLVFDAAGGVKYLSEVHVPGMDGWALQGAPVEHTHELLSGTE